MNTTSMTTTLPVTEKKPASGLSANFIYKYRQMLVLPVLFIVASLVFYVMAPGFATADNLVNVARQSVYLLIVSLGQLIVLVVGGLDLSVGAIAALTSVAAALVMASMMAAMPDSPWLAIAAGSAVGFAVGAVFGLINGVGMAVMRIPPFMMTLGMSSVLFGITLFISGGVPVYGLPDVLGEVFGFGEIMGIPIPSLVALLLILITYGLLEWSRFGRHVYATGGNQRAADLSGIRTKRVIIQSFVICGVFASLTGLLLTARLGTGEANVGVTLPLESIAACVIAGVSLAGGVGRVFAVVVGTLLIMLVQNGLNLMQVGAYASTMTIGLILILAMALSRK